MYRRNALLEVGGFDVPSSEDYDVDLKLARRSRIACYPEIVAEYRKQTGNMSARHLKMLQWAPYVQARNIEDPSDPTIAEMSRLGRARFRAYYAREILLAERLHPGGLGSVIVSFARAVKASPRYVVGATVRRVMRRLSPAAIAMSGKPLGNAAISDAERQRRRRTRSRQSAG
jgi:hypothetical protein